MKRNQQLLTAAGALLLGWQSAAMAAANLNIRVVDEGQPVPGVSVRLVDVSGETAVAANDDNNDGVVLLPVSQAGSYVIVTRAPNGTEQRTRVAVPPSGSHALRVNLPGGAAAASAPVAGGMGRADHSAAMGHGSDDPISYDYMQVNWIIDSEVEDVGGDDFDGEGVGFDASKGLGHSYFFRASAWAPVYNDDSALVTDSEFALTDWQSVAFGFREDVLRRGGTSMDVFLQAGYDRLQFGGPLLPDPATGLGLAGGIRLAVNSFELDISVRYADASAGDVDVEPMLYSADLRYKVTPNLALSVGYADGEVEIKDSSAGLDEEPDLSMFTAGLRYYYNQPWRSGRMLPKDPPTTYNYLQMDYVVDGEFNVEGTPGNDSLDTDRGIGIDASYLLADNVFLRATNWTMDYDVPGSTSDIVLTDMLSAGPGLRYGMPVGKGHIDGYLQVTYDRMNTIGLTAEGYGGEVGLRYLILPGLEFNAWYREASTEGKLAGNDIDIDPELWGLRLIFGPENAEKWDDIDFVIALTDGEAEVDDGVGEQDVEFDALSFGVRYSY